MKPRSTPLVFGAGLVIGLFLGALPSPLIAQDAGAPAQPTASADPLLRYKMPANVFEELSPTTRALLAAKEAQAAVPLNVPSEGAIDVKTKAQQLLEKQSPVVLLSVPKSRLDRLAEEEKTKVGKYLDAKAYDVSTNQALIKCMDDLTECEKTCKSASKPVGTTAPSAATGKP